MDFSGGVLSFEMICSVNFCMSCKISTYHFKRFEILIYLFRQVITSAYHASPQIDDNGLTCQNIGTCYFQLFRPKKKQNKLERNIILTVAGKVLLPVPTGRIQSISFLLTLLFTAWLNTEQEHVVLSNVSFLLLATKSFPRTEFCENAAKINLFCFSSTNR